jgi:RimJ/RimL family protein N-acetyltransferase
VQAAIGLVFDHTAAVRVIGITDARNHASIRLLQRIGMQRVETRDAVFRGEPCTEHVYAVSRLWPAREAATPSAKTLHAPDT